MKIAFDARPIVRSRNRGIGNYAINLYTELLMHEENEYCIFNDCKESVAGEFAKFNVMEYRFPDFFSVDVENICLDNNIDVFFTANIIDLSRLPLSNKQFGKTLLTGTVHDVIPFMMRDKYLRSEIKYNEFVKNCKGIEEYDLVFTDSKITERDITENFKPRRTKTIYLDGNRKLSVGIRDNNSILEYYHITEKYFISITGPGPNKNLDRIIKGFEKSKDSHNYQLVIVFSMSDFIFNELQYYIINHHLRNKIILVNSPSDEKLSVLINNASWLVMVSLYEGFGMPLLEAWECGTPVMCSNNTSLGEISQDAAVHVDPYSMDDICRGFLLIANMSDNERMEFVCKGIEKRKQFSWTNTASILIESLEQLVTGRM